MVDLNKMDKNGTKIKKVATASQQNYEDVNAKLK